MRKMKYEVAAVGDLDLDTKAIVELTDKEAEVVKRVFVAMNANVRKSARMYFEAQ